MKVLILLFFFFGAAFCDTPANCTYEEIRGTWVFYETDRIYDSNANCANENLKRKTTIDLLFPNIAVDHYGNKGTWTIIYNQGFEVTVNYRKYFGWSDYDKNGDTTISYCDRTKLGYSHDILGNNWSCFNGKKTAAVKPKISKSPINSLIDSRVKFRNDHGMINKINGMQSYWKAKSYEHFESFTLQEMHRLKGGKNSRHTRPQKIEATNKNRLLREQLEKLPEEFDWRNVDGINFVSPVRNQEKCGSCYAFSSVGMIEARIRVETNNTEQPILSPQDIVSCSKYSQGCDGGFPYLIAGKYGQDYGLVPEECAPYIGENSQCKNRNCTKVYTAYYQYVGGFYGACNEDLMKLELVKGGPLSIGFEVYDDFMQYSGGIYHHTGLKSGYNPFELTNHAVLLVGYGVDRSKNENYWIVKNSWGTGWGEQGYFRIRRGTDECGIESLAVKAIPIP